MIPREILKKIRQIEIRTNRIVVEVAGERTRLGCGPTRLVSDIPARQSRRARRSAEHAGARVLPIPQFKSA